MPFLILKRFCHRERSGTGTHYLIDETSPKINFELFFDKNHGGVSTCYRQEGLIKAAFHKRGDMEMPGQYQDHMTGEYYETQEEALYQEKMHQEFFIDADDEERARRKREYELMDQERQRRLEEEAWRQYQAQLREQEERKRWRELPREQQIKEIVNNTLTWGVYEPVSTLSKVRIIFWGSCYVACMIALIWKSGGELDTFAALFFGIISFALLLIILRKSSCMKEEENGYKQILEAMKTAARNDRSSVLTINFSDTLELEQETAFLWRSIYIAAKYGFEIANPELQELYKKTKEELVRRNETQDLDWESLWNEKPKETAA